LQNDEMNALGRSVGGYSTKLHVLTDAKGTLLAWTVTPGQRHESQELEHLLANSFLTLECFPDRQGSNCCTDCT